MYLAYSAKNSFLFHLVPFNCVQKRSSFLFKWKAELDRKKTFSAAEDRTRDSSNEKCSNRVSYTIHKGLQIPQYTASTLGMFLFFQIMQQPFTASNADYCVKPEPAFIIIDWQFSYPHVFKIRPKPGLFWLFSSFSQSNDKYSTIGCNLCLGFEPGTAG